MSDEQVEITVGFRCPNAHRNSESFPIRFMEAHLDALTLQCAHCRIAWPATDQQRANIRHVIDAAKGGLWELSAPSAFMRPVQRPRPEAA